MQRNLRASAVSAVVLLASLVAMGAMGASTSSPAVPFDGDSDTPALMIAATALYSVMALSLLALGWYLGRAWSAAIGGSSLPTLSTLAAAVASCAFLVMVVLFGEASNNEATSRPADEMWTLTVIATGTLAAGVSVVAALLTLRRGGRQSPMLQPR
ncbi:hypothetical protein ELQ92_02200 [Labedella populi]|uniref:Integral membrane protein n=1 Tax=Labedella populi TaxID=2498850 RepID=A0A3S4CEI9_9MICO|nr:hypothetical protein [Labedella populi]RWZ68084.1 hypothetical protein ELQ92_02200 [Labedella populi]